MAGLILQQLDQAERQHRGLGSPVIEQRIKPRGGRDHATHAAELDPERRRALRQTDSRLLLTKIATECDQLARTVLPKSPLGDALRYLTNQWAALQRFVEDGRLAIDNNRAENQLRIVALGRKNWLFAGSFEGARRAALLYSLVQSCQLINISPFEEIIPTNRDSKVSLLAWLVRFSANRRI